MSSTGTKDESQWSKIPWTPAEDNALKRLVRSHGPSNWSLISKNIPGRSDESCRLRWKNFSPRFDYGPFSPDYVLKNHRNSSLNSKDSPLTLDDREIQPLNPPASTGAGNSDSDMFLRHSSPSGSDHSILGNFFSPMTKADPFTSLSLSLPGSSQALSQPHVTEPHKVVTLAREDVFSMEFKAILREMVRKEIRIYISEMEREGSRLQQQAERSVSKDR